MTPVTPSSSSKGSKSKGQTDLKGGEDEWQPKGEGAADASEDEYKQEHDNEDGSSPKKRKTKESAQGSPKAKGKAKATKAAAGAWTENEVLALYKATHLLALQNIPAISEHPGLEDRANGPINMKMRSEFKKTEKALGGDGKWIDEFKLLPAKKSS